MVITCSHQVQQSGKCVGERHAGGTCMTKPKKLFPIALRTCPFDVVFGGSIILMV